MDQFNKIYKPVEPNILWIIYKFVKLNTFRINYKFLLKYFLAGMRTSQNK